MNSKVAVYNSHKTAVKAVKALVENGIPAKHISLIGKAEVNDDDNVEHIQKEKIEKTTAVIGMGAGTLAGLLTGLGVFTIPGFGFLYGAGAAVGAIGGFELGALTGGLFALLEDLGIRDDKFSDFEERLNKGEFIITINGSEAEVIKAEKILHTQGTHLLID